jgi:putative transposase
VPRGLYRFHHSRSPHFITFTCYHRLPHLADLAVRDLFVQALERTRTLYCMRVYGFVVMPEHVHLLLSEPERGTIANVIQSLKISSAKRARQANAGGNPEDPFWQKRYYDRNEWNHKEFIEKLKYVHRNPVKRKLVEKPEDWKWSSYRHYASGDNCGVEIESGRNRTYTLNPYGRREPTIAN